MKKFLNKIAIFCGTGLVAAILVQAFFSMRLEDRNIRGNDTLHIENQDAELVLLGSSRCWAHFDPRFFESAFGLESINIGITGHSEIPLATMRLQNYLSKNKAPQFVIYNFDPFANADSKNVLGNFTIKDDFSRYAFWPDKRDEPILDYFGFSAAEKYIPAYALMKYKMIIPCLFPSKTNRYVRYGYDNNDEVWDTIANPVTDVMKKHYFKNSDIPDITMALKQLHALCRKNNIVLICIQTPVYRSLYEAATFSRNKTICQVLDIPFIDADNESFHNDIRSFYNSNHLNRYGVEKMNAQLQSNPKLIAILGKREHFKRR